MTADVVVVGGGIVGAACAWAVSERGLRVVLVDASEQGGTAAGMGHLVAMDDSTAQLALTVRSLVLWDRLAERLPAEANYDRCGTIWLAATADEQPAADAKRQRLAAAGLESQWLGADELSDAEPSLRHGLHGGVRIAADRVLYPPVVTRWLLDETLRTGGRVVRGVPVASFAGDGVTLKDGRTLSAGRVVLAAGMGMRSLCPSLPLRLKKGHLAITDRMPGFLRHQLLALDYLTTAHGRAAWSVAFNVQPRTTGQVLVGSSRQYDDATTDLDRPVLAAMLRQACGYLHGLAETPVVRMWTGHRVVTPDNLPLIGPHGDVLLACGHEGLGITTSVATAELVADAVTGEVRSPLDPAAYAPGRLPNPA